MNATFWERLGAHLYDPFLWFGERRGQGARRRQLLAAASGRVLEIGAGTGLNVEHYPASAELILTEPAESMAARLHTQLRRAGRAAEVVAAGAEALPVQTASIDTVVSTMVLCTVPDPAAALAEIVRVLRPGGRLLFCEHVRSESVRLARWQHRLARSWQAFALGCHSNRDLLPVVARALRISELERAVWHGMPAVVHPLIVGTAVR